MKLPNSLEGAIDMASGAVPTRGPTVLSEKHASWLASSLRHVATVWSNMSTLPHDKLALLPVPSSVPTTTTPTTTTTTPTPTPTTVTTPSTSTPTTSTT
jgi:hypothetical protein